MPLWEKKGLGKWIGKVDWKMRSLISAFWTFLTGTNLIITLHYHIAHANVKPSKAYHMKWQF
jgi:hypothetical protein